MKHLLVLIAIGSSGLTFAIPSALDECCAHKMSWCKSCGATPPPYVFGVCQCNDNN